MSIDAMKQAIEALENVRSYDKQDLYGLDKDITALRTAIEQVEKPVAYRWKGELFTPGEIEMLDVTDAVPLYAHQRRWVGLANEEIEAVMQGSVEGERMLPYQLARAIEAKLKAKNEAP
jgi:hypothetical protein